MDASSIGASAPPMAAFSGFYESHKPPPSEDARGIVPAHRDGHETASKVGSFFIVVPFAANTERLVARWRRLLAYIIALDLLHRAMRAVSHHRTAMAIEIASDGGAFVRRRHLLRLL